MIHNQRGISSIGIILTVCVLFGLIWVYNTITTISQIKDLNKRLEIASNANNDDEVIMLSGLIIQLPLTSFDFINNQVRSDTYLLRGCAFLHKGNVKDAMACFQSSVQYDPQNASSYYMGLIYESINDEKNAVAAYKKYLRLKGDVKDKYTDHAKKYLE